jgi:TetR/AcrR family transcriptional regulator
MARRDSERRTRILEAAVGVFADGGLKGATIRRVGQAAGVNSALLYYYYDSKEALFTEAVTMVLQEFLAHLRARRHPFRGARDRLQFLVDGVFGYYARYPDRMSLIWLAVSRHPDLFGRALNRIVAAHDLVPLEVISDGMRKGELRSLHPVEAWWSIVGMCLFSLQVRDVLRHVSPASISKPSSTLEERKEQILKLLLEGITAGHDVKKQAKRRIRP